MGVSVWGGSQSRGFLSEGGLSPAGFSVKGGGGGSLSGRSHMVKNGRFTSHWNAFLLYLGKLCVLRYLETSG